MRHLLIIVSFVLIGCGANYSLMADKDLQKVEERLTLKIDSMDTQIQKIADENAALHRRLKADFKVLFSRLDQGQERTIARLEENQHSLENLGKTSNKILSQKATIVASTNSDSTVVDSLAGPSLADLELERIYSAARTDFNTENYKQAYVGFKEVYEKKPTSKLGENALYWMAICYERSGQLDNSIIVMERVLEEFQQGNKLCTAHFQLSRMYKEKANTEKTNQHLTFLVENSVCTGSNESFRATEMLSKKKQ
jgi:TolA-binding protein